MRAQVQDTKLQAIAATKVMNSTTSNQPSTTIVNKATFTLAGTDKEERRRALAAEVRQKVASAAKVQISSTEVLSKQALQSPVTAQTHLQQSAQKALAHQQQQAQQRSPMDTYEMSEGGESDSDSDVSEYSPKAPKKRVS